MSLKNVAQKCGIIADYRTLVEDFERLIEFNYRPVLEDFTEGYVP